MSKFGETLQVSYCILQSKFTSCYQATRIILQVSNHDVQFFRILRMHRWYWISLGMHYRWYWMTYRCVTKDDTSQAETRRWTLYVHYKKWTTCLMFNFKPDHAVWFHWINKFFKLAPAPIQFGLPTPGMRLLGSSYKLNGSYSLPLLEVAAASWSNCLEETSEMTSRQLDIPLKGVHLLQY